MCPGTSSWNSFVGRIDNALGNLADAAEVGRAHGSRGYLIADWGDNGHLQPPSVSFGPILYGGAVSWCLDSNRDLDLTEALSTHVFGDRTGGVADAAKKVSLEAAAISMPFDKLLAEISAGCLNKQKMSVKSRSSFIWNGDSRGTKAGYDYALQRGKMAHLVNFSREVVP